LRLRLERDWAMEVLKNSGSFAAMPANWVKISSSASAWLARTSSTGPRSRACSLVEAAWAMSAARVVAGISLALLALAPAGDPAVRSAAVERGRDAIAELVVPLLFRHLLCPSVIAWLLP
jgi:hypothetical protein